MEYWMAFMCALIGPLKDAGYEAAHGPAACVRVYHACTWEGEDFDTCLWGSRTHPDVQLVRTENRVLPRNPF